MDLPVTINSAVAATRRQDFIAQAEADRMARRARGAGHARRGRFLARFAAAVIDGHSTGGQTVLQFMDFHEDLKLPQEAIEQIASGTRQHVTDEHGVRQVELFHNADGQVYCALEGPDEDATRQHHHALGVPCGDVHQVASPFPGSS
jgi:Protein of unknown function (DUF4242)